MRKLLKWTGVALGGLAGALLVAGAVLYQAGGARLARTWEVPVAAVRVPSDSAAVARGRHLSDAMGLCLGCHGEDMSGKVLFDESGIATVYASNLTSGRGGRGAVYTDVDFVRAIRHGVNREGRGILVMHSDAYHGLGAEDLGAIVAYLKSLPPVDNEVPEPRATPIGKIMIALGLFDSDVIPLIPAERIDHDAPLAPAPRREISAAYGHYVVSLALCTLCHGADLGGGPPVEPGAPPSPNIAAYAASGTWTEEQFVATLRTGVTPYGKRIDPEVMPWEHYARMSDDELAAIWQYMASLAGG